MTAAKLEKPSIDYQESFLEALSEFQREGRFAYWSQAELNSNFPAFLDMLCQERGKPHQPFQEWVEPVPETILWFVKDAEYLGSVYIRHRLNWHLEKWGGHLSFILRPSMRGKGFTAKMIYKTMPFANYIGIDNALITVDPEDIPMVNTLESCGAIYENTLPATKQFPSRARYWLDCS